MVCLSFVLVPQIVHNFIKGHTFGFDKKYLVYFCLSKFAIIFYLRGVDNNAFELKPSYGTCLAIFISLSV